MVSVIVPVYNVDKFLRLTIDSILSSTYKDIELILVDDGSTDESPAICDEYSQADNRVKVVHKQNGGVSSARIEGLRVAKGEYISFVDGDDVIHSEMLEILINALQKDDFDFSMCYLRKIHEGEEIKSLRTNVIVQSKIILGANDYSKKIYSQNNNEIIQYHVVHNKLYRRSLVDEDMFCDLRSGEDTVWNHHLCLKMKKAILVEAELYYYIQHATSLTHEQMNPNYLDWIRSYDICLGFIPHENLELRKNCLLQLYKVMALILMKSHHTSFEEDVKKLNRDIFNRTKTEFCHCGINRYTKYRLMTFFHSPWTYRLFMKICNLVAKFH